MAGGGILEVVAHGGPTEVELLGFTVIHSFLSSLMQLFTYLESFDCLVFL